MMNGNDRNHKKKIVIHVIYFILICSFTFACFCPLSLAGNKVIVEDRVQELDELNKRVIQQIPSIPEYGHIDMKAKVLHGKWRVNFKIYQQKMTITNTKSGTVNFDNNQQKKPLNKEKKWFY